MECMQIATRPVPRLVREIEEDGYIFRVWEASAPTNDIQRCLAHGIRVGPSWEEACVEITVSAQEIGLASDTAAINHVKYMPCCSSSSKALQRGGGSAAMLRVACIYVVKTYNWVNRFKLDDCSKIACEIGGEKLFVSLPPLMLSYSGMTWYEREFGAVLDPVSAHATYRQLVDKYLCSADGKHMSFDDFVQAFNIPTDHLQELSVAYERNTTLQGFFNDLKQSHTCDQQISFGAMVMPWVEHVVNQATSKTHLKTWYIPVSAITESVRVCADCCHGCCKEIKSGLWHIVDVPDTPDSTCILPMEVMY